MPSFFCHCAGRGPGGAATEAQYSETGTVTFYEILNLQELYLKITKYHIIGFEILYNSGQILF